MAERPVDWTNSTLACLPPFTFDDFTCPFNLKSRRFTSNPCLFKLARDRAMARKSTANLEKMCLQIQLQKYVRGDRAKLHRCLQKSFVFLLRWIQFVRERANASGIPTGFERAFAGSQAQLLSVLPWFDSDEMAGCSENSGKVHGLTPEPNPASRTTSPGPIPRRVIRTPASFEPIVWALLFIP